MYGSERHQHYVKNIVKQQYIIYSTVIAGLAYYVSTFFGQWLACVPFVAGTLLILVGVMKLIKLRAEEQLKIWEKMLSPTRFFP